MVFHSTLLKPAGHFLWRKKWAFKKKSWHTPENPLKTGFSTTATVGYSRDSIIAIMELDLHCTDMLDMRHQGWWGLYGFFKRLLMSPPGRQRNPRQNIWFLMINIQANRVAMVSSVITKIFKQCKHWTVTIQPLSGNTQTIMCLFVHCQFYCSTFVFFVWISALLDSVFDYSMFN